MKSLCWGITLLLLFVAGVGLPAAASAAPSEPTPAPHQPDLRADQAVVAQVSFADQADLNRIAGDLDIWSVDHASRRATILLTPSQLRQLVSAGRPVSVDWQATAQLSAYAVRAAASTEVATGGIPSFPCYRTVEETYASMAQLAAAHPTLVQPITLGESWQSVTSGGVSGYPIEGLVLTNQAIGGPKAIFFVMAAIHARELVTAESVMRFAETLVQGYGRDPDATWLLDHTAIHIAPLANPDGRKKAETGLLWRKNTNNSQTCFFEPDSVGVDLNRNSSFRWNQCTGFNCSSSDACSLTYRGKDAASEPEVQAIERYLRGIFEDRRGPLDSDAAPVDASGLMITVHSYAPLILYPWGWTQAAAPNAAGLRTLARKFGFYTGYDVCQSGGDGCLYMTDGTTDDFAYGELGVAAFTFELGTNFFQSCSDFESSIITDTLASLTYAAKAARQPYRTPAGPEVISATAALTQVVSGQVMTVTVMADDTRSYYGSRFGEPPTEAVQAIQAVRYTVDAPSWALCGFAQAMAPVDSVFDTPVEAAVALVDTQGWAPGRHLLLVEAQDADGVWGAPTGVFVDVTDAEGNLPAGYTSQSAGCVELRLPWIVQDEEIVEDGDR